MRILAVDTTREQLTAVLVTDKKVYQKNGEAAKSGHSSSLFPFIAELMEQAGLKPEMLDAVCAVVGPGSFTGIRIGVAAVNAIAFAANLKRIEVDSFEILAQGRAGEVLTVIPAAHGNVFAAKFSDGKEIESGFYGENDLPAAQKTIRADEFSEFGDTLAAVCVKKFKENNFVDMLKPLYLRKSQAERMKQD
jgi:tRNA threonylcarbamoyl adenosine modification protein YeaZ